MLKYEAVSSDIIMRITQGEFGPNDRLPTIPELADHYGVSAITIKRALDELDARGLIARRRGSGTYVKGIPSLDSHEGGWSVSGQMMGFSTEHDALGETVTSNVHEFEIVEPPEEVRAGLRMEPEEFAYRICRTRFADARPRVVEYTYMPLNVVPGLKRSHVERSIYRYISDELGLTIDSAHRKVRAVNPTEQEVAWLGVEPSTPLLEVKQIGFLNDGTPFEWSISRHQQDYELLVISHH